MKISINNKINLIAFINNNIDTNNNYQLTKLSINV